MTIRKQFGIPENAIVVGTTAVFRFQKRLDKWMEIMHAAIDKNPNLYGIVIGAGVLENEIKAVLAIDGPVICEVILPVQYNFAPKLSSERKPDGRMVSKPMEDMFPFLSREEFLENMIIPVINE